MLIALAYLATLANAQQISFLHEGRALQQGDTLVVTATPEMIENEVLAVDLHVRNNTSETLQGLKAKCTPASPNPRLGIMSVCMGQCLPGDLSPEFSVDANATSNNIMTVDFLIPANPSGIADLFKLTVGNNADSYDNAGAIYILAQVGQVGIAEADAGATLRAYPNPATETVTIDYSLPKDGTLVVRNLLGSVVKTVTLTAGTGSARIDIATLPQGVYTYGMAGHAMQKLVVR